jgi:hypothetical protein
MINIRVAAVRSRDEGDGVEAEEAVTFLVPVEGRPGFCDWPPLAEQCWYEQFTGRVVHHSDLLAHGPCRPCFLDQPPPRLGLAS